MHPRVLVVDDDPNLRQGIRSRLHGSYDIEVAQGGQEALKKLAKDPAFSVIVCDFQMPGMDGIELLSRVREEFPQLVRVMLTGHGDMQVTAAAINTGGIFKMLFKPCLDGELEMAIKSACAQHDFQAAMQEMVLEDHLLGIGNRRAFDKALLRNDSLAKRHGRPYALAIADVDHFKLYNDSYGHVAGDTALQAVANAIRGSVRGSDEIFRYGGEELALLFPDTPSDGAAMACERIRESVAALRLPPGNPGLGVTISLGIAIFDGVEQVSVEDILLRADRALYASKSAGRNRVSLWSSTMTARGMDR